MDATRLKEDCCNSFYLLFSNDKGIRLRLNIPDTLVLERGQPLAWFFTSKEGYVQRQQSGGTTLPAVRQHFLKYAAATNASSYPAGPVAVARLADGLPKLLSQQDFEALCDRLEAALASGEAADDAPCVLQAYVPPFLDLRYITSYTNDGSDISCQSFQRRFSRRYVPFRSAAPPAPLPHMLSGTAADIACATAAATAAADAASPALDASAALDAVAAGGDLQLLDDKALDDMERSLGKTLGPVDPSLKMRMRKAAHGVVQYVQKAAGLTLRGLVCEFVRDGSGDVFFMGVLRADWASLIPGRGGEPWAAANLLQEAREEEECEEGMGQLGAQIYTVEDPGSAGPADCQGAGAGVTAGGNGGVTIIGETTTSVTIVGPSGERQTRTLSQRHVQHTPSMTGSPRVSITEMGPLPALDQQQQQEGEPGSPRIAAALCRGNASPGALRGPAAGEGKARSPGHQQPPSLQHGSLVKMPLVAARTPGTTRSHGSSVRSPPSMYGEWHHVNDGRKGASLLTSQLTRELVTLQDEVIMKTELADTLTAKVQVLEHDKHVITEAFERVVGELQADLQELRSRVNALRVERDSLAAQLEGAQAAAAASAAAAEEYRSRLEGERGTTLTSLGEFQRKQEEAVSKAAEAEAKFKALQEKFREEQVAYDALKKQMVFYQHTLSAAGLKRGDSFKDPAGLALRGERGEPAANPALALLRGQNNPEIKFWETLSAVEELLNREADPDGERYALAKVLHTCQGDLHAIFLYYCLLDSSFARHWPPQLTITGWMAFVKSSAVTNPVPGTRTRTEATLPVADMQELFRRLCARQSLLTGTGAATLSHSPSTKSGGRPTSAQSTTGMLATGRPTTSAAPPALANAALSFQGFCAALVMIAARLARASPEIVVEIPFLSEQTRAFIEEIVPRCDRVTPLVGQTKRTTPGGAGAAVAAAAAAAAAKQDKAREGGANRLPKLKKIRSKAGARPAASSGAAAPGRGEIRRITEASKEGSAAASSSMSVLSP